MGGGVVGGGGARSEIRLSLTAPVTLNVAVAEDTCSRRSSWMIGGETSLVAAVPDPIDCIPAEFDELASAPAISEGSVSSPQLVKQSR